MCHRCALCRSVTTCSVRREVALLPSTEASLLRSEGREGREKEKKKARCGRCNWQSTFVLRMSKHWNYLSRILPTGVFALKGWEGFLPYWFSWLYSTSASWKWCLRNMTAEKRGRQTFVCDKHDRAITCVFCRDLHLLLCSCPV